MSKKCGALRDLVSFVQFKKCEKHPWRSVNFSKVAGFKQALNRPLNVDYHDELLQSLSLINYCMVETLT